MEISVLALARVRAVHEALALPPPALLEQLPARGWLPLADGLAFLRQPGGAPLPPAVRRQLGHQLLSDWYHQAGGYAQCPQALDVLRHHMRAGSYAQMARGEGAGRFALLDIDEAAGLAHVHSSTPFCRDWEAGMIQGALDAPGDLLFSDVRWDAAQQRFELRFVSESNRTQVRWALGEPDETRLWRARNRVRQLEQQLAYHEARPQSGLGAAQARASSEWLDPLTGAASEAHLLERLQQAAQAPLPPRLCLLAFGLDMPAGEALRQLAAAGLRATRHHDLLARLGEHDLALLLADVDGHAAAGVAGRLAAGLPAPLRRRLQLALLPWTRGSAAALLAQAKAELRA